MLSRETQNKVIFAFTMTLVFILFRLGIVTKFFDAMLGNKEHLTKDGKDTMLGTLLVSFLFFLIALASAVFIL